MYGIIVTADTVYIFTRLDVISINHTRMVLTATLAFFCLLAGSHIPANAASRSIPVTVGDWNCMTNGQYKGNVSRVLIDVVPSNSPASGYVSGNTRSVSVIYTPSGSRVTVAAVAFCKTSWYGGGYYREISAGRWVDSSTQKITL